MIDFKLLDLARAVTNGHRLSAAEQNLLLELPCEETERLIPGAQLLRRTFFNSNISVCSIANAKSGRCPEDCAFCAQSVHHQAETRYYPLKSPDKLAETGRKTVSQGAGKFSLVTSGRGLDPKELNKVAQAVSEMAAGGIYTCASLGVLSAGQLLALKKSGLNRYHHNLETAPGFFSRVCTTHDFSERVNTVRLARQAGLSVCSGAVFGMGESDAQVMELALTLRELGVDAVPVNFLVPIPGTPLENMPRISPMRCLKIICLLRYMLPDKEIIVCGGRLENLGELHPLIFMAGASGIMTGNYLTRKGRDAQADLQLIRDLELTPV